MAAAALASVGLTGCNIGGSSSSPATARTVTPTTAVHSAASASPGSKLGILACHEYRAAIVNTNPAIEYQDLFTADAEAELAAKLEPSSEWSNLASTLDAVKQEIQQIDAEQPGSNSQPYNANGASNAATLGQSLGLLKGDLTAVSTLCTAYGI